MKRLSIILYLQVLTIILLSQQSGFPKLSGPYLGQKPPGMTPEIFAPGIISTEKFREFSGTFTPDGHTYYFFRFAETPVMMECTITDQGWTEPVPASFNSGYIDNEPHVTYDGTSLFFCSNRPYSGSGEGRIFTQVWIMRRLGETWSNPIHLQMGMAPTTTEDGKIYIGSTIYRMFNDSLELVEEIAYSNSVEQSDRLPADHTCISRNESYRLFDHNQVLYVSFRKKDGTWSSPINLSKKMDLEGGIILPTLSPDNNYLFFCYKEDIWWVSAKIIGNP